jgi:hypothetical protein
MYVHVVNENCTAAGENEERCTCQSPTTHTYTQDYHTINYDTVKLIAKFPRNYFTLELPWILLNPVKELYFFFTGVTIGFFHLDGGFRPWRHVESTKQGEFLFSCIHFATMDPLLTTGSMYPHRIWKYRPRGTISTGFFIADGVVIDGNGTRIHKTRWVLEIVYIFCKHGPVTYHLIDSST